MTLVGYRLGLITASKYIDSSLIKTLRSISLVCSESRSPVAFAHCSKLIVIPKSVYVHCSRLYEACPEISKNDIILDEGKGIYEAFNTGLENAKRWGCSHVAYINAGDTLESLFGENIKTSMQLRSCVVAGGVNIVGGNRPLIYYGGYQQWNVPHPATIYPIEALGEGYNTCLRISGDWHKHFEMRKKVVFVRTKRTIATFYCDGLSRSSEAPIICALDEFNQFLADLVNFRLTTLISPTRLVRAVIIFTRLAVALWSGLLSRQHLRNRA